MSETIDFVKSAFRETAKDYVDFLVLGEVFRSVGEGNACSQMYGAFVEKTINRQSLGTPTVNLSVASQYGLLLSDYSSYDAVGIMERVCCIFYVCQLHESIIHLLAKATEHRTKAKRINKDCQGAVFLRDLKKASFATSLTSLVKFEQLAQDIAARSDYTFISNVADTQTLLGSILSGSIYTDSIPSSDRQRFIFAK
jgi:hypothetical protein